MAIGILAALEMEISPLIGKMQVEHRELGLGRTFYRGLLEGQDVVMGVSGVGKIKAAACAQFLVDRFSIEKLILVGTAGAINPRLKVGDVVISRRVLEHDSDLGPYFKDKIERLWYQSDNGLVELALGAAMRLGLRERTHLGSVLTGDQAITLPEQRQRLWETFGGDCVEMEGAAVAWVCTRNGVPFVIIRAISDLAGSDSLTPDLQRAQQQFVEASLCAANVTLEMLKGLAS
jgi:adenosylhomocysteine nucleosidase